jgi:hypothetical protein
MPDSTKRKRGDVKGGEKCEGKVGDGSKKRKRTIKNPKKPKPGKSLAELQPDLAAQWHKKKNGDLTSWDVSCGSNFMAWWICSFLHEWKASVGDRAKGNGCPDCAKKKRKGPKKPKPGKSLAELRPNLAAQWNKGKNGDLTPWDVSCWSNFRVWWICSCCFYEWQSTVNNRTNGNGCPGCAKGSKGPRKPKPGKSLAELRPNLAAQWHEGKNGDLTPWDVSLCCTTKVWWICKKTNCDYNCLHVWKESVHNRAAKHPRGCPYCCKPAKQICYHNSLAYKYPEVTRQWHPTKNKEFEDQGINPKTISAYSNRKIWWICKNFNCDYNCLHIWKAHVYTRTKGRNCPYCCKPAKYICYHNSLAYKYPEVTRQWHPTKNKKLKYQGINPETLHVNSNISVWWLCNLCNNKWKTKITHRIYSQSGCPRCNLSHMERLMRKVLKNLKTQSTIVPRPWTIIKAIHSHRLSNGQEADHMVTLNINDIRVKVMIEMDGIQHFEPVEFFGGDEALKANQERDTRKNKLCQDKNYHLLRLDHLVNRNTYEAEVITFFNKVSTNPSSILIKNVGTCY